METAVAVRSDDAEEVLDVFLSIMRSVGHRVDPSLLASPPRDHDSGDVLCGAAIGGWVALRTHFVVPADALAVELSRRLDTLASAVMIYEDVLWMHHLVDRGLELDRYVNLPGYFGPGEYDDSWTGDATLVATMVGVDPEQVAPYFRQVSVRRARAGWRRPPKAHRSDAYHLLDGWVVTELWRRMGITWPDPGAASTLRVPLGREGTDALSEWLRAR